MNNTPYMDAVVQMVLFLELSDSATVDEDAAVEAMEQIAATLQKLGPAEIAQFLEYLRHRASKAESEREQDAIRDFAGNLGLMP